MSENNAYYSYGKILLRPNFMMQRGRRWVSLLMVGVFMLLSLSPAIA